MITDQEWSAWLRADDARRVWLVELDYLGGTERIARNTFIQQGEIWSDVLDELEYEDRLDAQVMIDRLSVLNAGDRDGWLTREWDGQPVRLYLGDESWPRSDFRQQAALVNGGLSDASDARLTFSIYNPLVLLDVPVQPVAQDITLPVMFGSPINVTPVPADTNLGYRVHDAAVTLSAVRDQGYPVAGYTATTGGFSLSQSNVGAITVDATAPGGSPAELIQALCDNVGLPTNAASLAALPAYAVAYYAGSGETCRQVLDFVLQGLGAVPRINLLGELEINRITAPAEQADLILTSDDIISLQLSALEREASDVVVKYARNWSVQQSEALAGAVIDADRYRYSVEYLQSAVSVSDNPLAVRIERESALIDEVDAMTERDRIAVLRSVPRRRWRLLVGDAGLEVRAGQTVRIQWPRWGFESGVNALVLSNRPSGRYLQKTELEVWL